MLRIGFIAFVLIINGFRGDALSVNDLYHNNNNEESGILPIGDDNYEFVKLGTPVHLYSETYDHLYVRHYATHSYTMLYTFPLPNTIILFSIWLIIFLENFIEETYSDFVDL